MANFADRLLHFHTTMSWACSKKSLCWTIRATSCSTAAATLAANVARYVQALGSLIE